MNDKTKQALELAMGALEEISSQYMSLPKNGCMALAAIKEALAEQPAQLDPSVGTQVSKVWWDGNKLMAQPIPLEKLYKEPEQPAQHQEAVTVLPDGSAFAVMSYPLPKDHWLYADRQYNDGADEPVELGRPILTHEMRDAVVSAVRYAIRGATNCGKEVDFDPDALVQNAVYALCGPFTSPKPAQQQEPVLWQILNGVCHAGVRSTENLAKEAAAGMQKTHDLGGSLAAFHVRPLYTSPPANANAGKPWRELTKPEKKAVLQKTAESIESGNIIMTHWPLVANAIEAAVIEKNAPNGITGEQK